jgi:hypothetical protein
MSPNAVRLELEDSHFIFLSFGHLQPDINNTLLRQVTRSLLSSRRSSS